MRMAKCGGSFGGIGAPLPAARGTVAGEIGKASGSGKIFLLNGAEVFRELLKIRKLSIKRLLGRSYISKHRLFGVFINHHLIPHNASGVTISGAALPTDVSNFTN